MTDLKANWANGETFTAADANAVAVQINAHTALIAALQAGTGSITPGSVKLSDLVAGVQATLAKADAALQSVPLNSVGSGQISDGAVAFADLSAALQLSISHADTALQTIAAGSVGSSEIADGTVSLADLTTSLQSAVALANTALQTIAAGSIGSTQIADGGVTYADLASSVQASVTLANTALQSVPTNSVGTAQIADGTVGMVDLNTALQAAIALAGTAVQPAALATRAFRTDLNATSEMVAALRDTPVGAGMSVTLQASGSAYTSATSTVTGTWFSPDWQPSTFYPAGAQVLKLSDGMTVIRRTTPGTSRASYDATEAALWTELPQGAQVTYPMRYNTAFIRRRNVGSNVYGHRGPKYPDGTQESDYNGCAWTTDWDQVVTTGSLEVSVYDQTAVRLVVDGQYVSATQTQFTGTSDYQWRNVKFSGIPLGYRRMRLEVGSNWASISGIKIATGDVVYPPSTPKTKRLAICHDSYAEGFTDGTAVNVIIDSWATKLAQALGFNDFANLSKSATGFTAPSTKLYAPRIDDAVLLQPDYLIICGSVNDQPNENTTLAAAAQALYTDALTRLPNTKIIATGPPNMNLVSDNDIMTGILKTAWAAAGGDPAMFIDTTQWGVVPAGWMTSGHPNALGHKYLASRFSVEVASRWNLPVPAPALPFPTTLAAAPLDATINPQTGTTYTVAASDDGKIVTLTNAAATTLTFPQDSAQAFPVGGYVEFHVLGAGQVTCAAGTGATVNSRGGALKSAGQYAIFGARKRAANTWIISGDLSV